MNSQNAMTATAAAPTKPAKRQNLIAEGRTYSIKTPSGNHMGDLSLNAGGAEDGGAIVNGSIYFNTTDVGDVKQARDMLALIHRDLAANRGVDLDEEGDVKDLSEPEHQPQLFGTVGVNSIGKPGLITGFKKLPWGWSYVGFNPNDGTEWCSRDPHIIAPNLAVFIGRLQRVAYDIGRRGEPLKVNA